MQPWATEVSGGWLPASLTPWQLSTCLPGAMASATSMACSDRYMKVVLP